MKTTITTLLFGVFLFLQTSAQVQIYKDASKSKYLVCFSDKKGTMFNINEPENFLSQRSLERRSKYNIPIDSFDLPVSEVYLNQLKQLGVKVEYSSKWINGVIVEFPDTSTISSVSALNFVRPFRPLSIKSNKNKPRIYYSHYLRKHTSIVEDNYYDYGYSENQITMLNGNLLHNAGFRGKGVQIAVLDAGFYKANTLPSFDSLMANKRVLGTRDIVAGRDVYAVESNHGMKVLSTIAANIPGKLIGTAPEASFYLIRTENANSEFPIEEVNWAIGAEFADSCGVDIISSSLGYTDFDDKVSSHTYSDLNGHTAIASCAATIASRKGILVVNSAGNEGDSEWRHIGVPADADNILAIGATDSQGERAYFSSQGPSVDGRIKPDISAQGYSVALQGLNGDVTTSSGTSFSAPIISGMVACLWQAHRQIDNISVIEAIKQSASLSSNPDTLLGYGIPDFNIANQILYAMENESSKTKESILVYPNPFINTLNINYYTENPKIIKVEIYSMLGNLVYSQSLNYTVSASLVQFYNFTPNLKQGIYMLRISTGSRLTQQKIIKG